jgi:UDP-N-acetyl-D-mannosaminuronate dehydrogenase
MRISVIGQGYVGLPLAVAAAKSGFEVDGVDTDIRVQHVAHQRPGEMSTRDCAEG